MESIEIFYQGEGIRETESIESGPDGTFASVKAAIAQKHGLPSDSLIFVQDSDEPASEMAALHEHAGPVGLNVHVHRCRQVEAAVTFNRETVSRAFGPGTTVARVKRWAARDRFKMSEADAAEHVLQIAGTQDRPAPGTHLGTLAACPACRVSFDLVPNQRINGMPGGGAA